VSFSVTALARSGLESVNVMRNALAPRSSKRTAWRSLSNRDLDVGLVRERIQLRIGDDRLELAARQE